MTLRDHRRGPSTSPPNGIDGVRSVLPVNLDVIAAWSWRVATAQACKQRLTRRYALEITADTSLHRTNRTG